MPNTPATLIFALLTAFWAGTSAVFTGMKLLAERRDAIVIAKLGSTDIDREARRHILRFEWVPIRFALGLVSAMLGTIIAALPTLATPPSGPLRLICWLAALVPFSGAGYFLGYGAFEYAYLRGLVDDEPPSRTTPAAAGAPREGER
jgi:hypothetical protein